MSKSDTSRSTSKSRIRQSAYAVWTVILAGNGLVVCVAVYASLFSPLLIEDSGRITVQNAYFVKDPVLGWRMMPNLSGSLQESEGGPSTPYCTTDDGGFRVSPRKPGRDTVVLLGDSFVQGY